MSKWINFSNLILKKINIDFFSESESDLTISCHYHQNQLYLTSEETFQTYDELFNRYVQLQKLLGIE